ncbi:hypothetical protein ACLOJK_014253 [Asimina triloba]
MLSYRLPHFPARSRPVGPPQLPAPAPISPVPFRHLLLPLILLPIFPPAPIGRSGSRSRLARPPQSSAPAPVSPFHFQHLLLPLILLPIFTPARICCSGSRPVPPGRPSPFNLPYGLFDKPVVLKVPSFLHSLFFFVFVGGLRIPPSFVDSILHISNL